MAKRFAGKTVMITGAAGGFGAAAARRFSAEGAKLLLSDLHKSKLDELTEELRKYGEIASENIDLTSENAVAAHIGHTPWSIDIAINNAGIGQSLVPLQMTETAEFDRVMAVNARAVFLCMKHQLPGMIVRRAGVILNVSSAAGVVGSGHLAAYAASKHAVIGLTKSAADEVARYNIRVNALCPSFAPTELFHEMADEMADRHGTDRQGASDRVTARIPMRRVATVDEVVQAMLWACDPENSFMTGQAISIDGGLTAV